MHNSIDKFLYLILAEDFFLVKPLCSGDKTDSFPTLFIPLSFKRSIGNQ